MQQATTRAEVLEYLAALTDEFDEQNMQYFTAQSISSRLNISRNLASQYLNDLVKDSSAIKIVSRPVLFFHKKTIERKYHQKINMNVFRTLVDLLDILNNKDTVRLGFKKAVGFNASLRVCVEQCKAAMQYPPNGLPLLLWGAPGTGKDFLARQMFEYALGNNCVCEGSTFIRVNCGEYANDEELFWQRLLSQDADGWLHQAAGGVLLFTQVHLLPYKIQMEFFSQLDAIVADDSINKQTEKRCKLVFSTNMSPQETLERAFLRRIPIVINLPSLDERSIEEKRELISEFLKEESAKVGTPIHITQQAFYALLHFHYPENLSQLRSMIQIGCAKAYLHHEQKNDGIILKLYHLPEDIIETYRPDLAMADGNQIVQLEAMNDLAQEKSAELVEAIEQARQAYVEQKTDFAALMNMWHKAIYAYDDFLVFNCRYSNNRVEAVGQVVSRILETVIHRYNVQFLSTSYYTISRMIYDAVQAQPFLQQVDQRTSKDLAACSALIEKNRPQLFMIAQETASLVAQNLNVQLSPLHFLMLQVYIDGGNPDIVINDTVAVIIAHGYATASSIAQTANALLQTQLFVPFDMPLPTKTSAIVSYVKQYVHTQRYFKNLILMVDMGSLEEIDDGLKDINNFNIGIVNNITTKLALAIGVGIIKGNDIETILKTACNEAAFHYRMVYRHDQRDAVVFVGDNSSNTAQRMQQLFVGSLPKKIDVDILTRDFRSLSKEKEEEDIFKQRNVLFLSGVLNPGIPQIPFIPIENIIGLLDFPEFHRYFSKHLDAAELETFGQNLLKNFSMQNVVKHLTILDADRLLNFVEEAVQRLQKFMNKQFTAKTKAGLYIHICCLIERLVTKTPVESYEGLDEFLLSQKDLIAGMQASFEQICASYNVVLPVTEIGYIYDYILAENTGGLEPDTDF